MGELAPDLRHRVGRRAAHRLSDFRNVRSSGLIAMKLDDGDHLIGVATCREGDDVFLATRLGRCIRFHIVGDNLRVFSGRDSSGVRGIRLADGDEVISLSVLRHVEATPDQRAAYLKAAAAKRRSGEDEEAVAADIEDGEEASGAAPLPPDQFAKLEDAEEILLTVTDAGFGKRSSAYYYRTTGRGGQGITNIALSARNGAAVVASFPVRPGDGVMLVTDEGRLIRVPSDQVRVTGRSSMGVTLFRLGDTEKVTAVFPIVEAADANGTDVGAADLGTTDPSVTNLGVTNLGVTSVGVADLGMTDLGVTGTGGADGDGPDALDAGPGADGPAAPDA